MKWFLGNHDVGTRVPPPLAHQLGGIYSVVPAGCRCSFENTIFYTIELTFQNKFTSHPTTKKNEWFLKVHTLRTEISELL